MENNFTTQLSDNGTAEQIKAGYLDYSDAIDPAMQAQERMQNRKRAARAELVNRKVEQAADYLKGRPLLSVGIAAGLGLVLARLMKTR